MNDFLVKLGLKENEVNATFVPLFTNLSPTSKYGTAIPLFVIASLTGSKELLEDSKRKAQDMDVNNRKVKVLQGTSFIDRQWKDLVVGNIVRVENSGYFPADLVLLSSSEPEALCYIETSSLDGYVKIIQYHIELQYSITKFNNEIFQNSNTKLKLILMTFRYLNYN
ncbi:hypothetical protein HDV02_002717 [Globomyces sp. JEL0801]|nr:hypothetical protein HDV02_002717 [Globomyces sp. JEL0801]